MFKIQINSTKLLGMFKKLVKAMFAAKTWMEIGVVGKVGPILQYHII